jgi:tetratricopeptide (TPR) repeat protein
LHPTLADAFFRLGQVYRALNDAASAATALKRAEMLDPRDPEASYLAGQSLKDLGKTDAAIAAWERTLAKDLQNQQALYSLMRALRKDHPGEATLLADRLRSLELRKLALERAKTLNNLALTKKQEGNWAAAVSGLREAIQTCGDCDLESALHKNLGLVQRQAGDYEAGERELRLALNAMPHDPEIHRALGILGTIRARSSSETRLNLAKRDSSAK